MSATLDPKFFERCSVTTHGTAQLEAYKAVYPRSTMVLFSRKTHTPLAALTLTAVCLSMLTGRPALASSDRPASPSDTVEATSYFQGMLNQPDQNFTFTITNLSNKGHIVFQLLHESDGLASVSEKTSQPSQLLVA